MTEEELQAVKDTGICHEIELDWKKLDIGVVLEDGSNDIEKYLISKCSVCGTEYRKTREDAPPAEPVVVDLDGV